MASGHDAAPGHKGLVVTVEMWQLPVCWQPPGDADSQAHSRLRVRRHLWRPLVQSPSVTPTAFAGHLPRGAPSLADRLSWGCAGAALGLLQSRLAPAVASTGQPLVSLHRGHPCSAPAASTSPRTPNPSGPSRLRSSVHLATPSVTMRGLIPRKATSEAEWTHVGKVKPSSSWAQALSLRSSWPLGPSLPSRWPLHVGAPEAAGLVQLQVQTIPHPLSRTGLPWSHS